MFEWLRRVFRPSEGGQRQRVFETLDDLNAEVCGGSPIATTQVLGILKLRSGTLMLGDPMYVPDLEVPNLVATRLEISASLWRYPSGAELVTALSLRADGGLGNGCRRKIGELGIDSAKLVVADKADIEEHWMDTGNDRIGVILTIPDDFVLRTLTKRFKLKTHRVDAVRAEVIGPVSESLAEEIEDYLKSNPRYERYPRGGFFVQTNNSFERANFMAREWGFIPIGKSETPLMFVCGTGRGDGVYDLECEFVGEAPRVLSVTFIED